MRLTLAEQEAIRFCARQAFGPRCIVRLFGSRVDDARRGGDIDLHVVAEPADATIDKEIAFRVDLAAAIGEQRVDVVLRARTSAPQAIDDVAIRTGVRLL